MGEGSSSDNTCSKSHVDETERGKAVATKIHMVIEILASSSAGIIRITSGEKW